MNFVRKYDEIYERYPKYYKVSIRMGENTMTVKHQQYIINMRTSKRNSTKNRV